MLPVLITLLCSIPQPNAMPAHTLSVRHPSYWSSPCSQLAAERTALMREAEKERYTVSMVEFIGNEHIHDHVLRRRVLLNEGDLFRKRRLLGSIHNLNRLRTIEPVRLANVEIRLHRENKLVYLLMCFHERHP